MNLNLNPLAKYIPAFYSNGGRPATHQAQFLHSLILFVLLFNETKAHTSLTLWVRKVLPESISLTVLIGCASTEELPPLGSYYDFMNRFWLAPRDSYSRSFLLPAVKNGRKPKKESGADGKLIEPEDPSSITTRDIANSIMDGKPASENPEAALQKIFSILAMFPSLRLGLVDSDDLTCRLIGINEFLCFRVNILELCIPVNVLVSNLEHFLVRLFAVAKFLQCP